MSIAEGHWGNDHQIISKRVVGQSVKDIEHVREVANSHVANASEPPTIVYRGIFHVLATCCFSFTLIRKLFIFYGE